MLNTLEESIFQIFVLGLDRIKLQCLMDNMLRQNTNLPLIISDKFEKLILVIN